MFPRNTVAVFNNGHSIITVDDHCYVIKNRHGSKWILSGWIFKEALHELKKLPTNPDDAQSI